MDMLSLPEAWHWVQVGFCAAFGAFLPLTIITAIMASAGRPALPSTPEYPDPHCSRCCPNPDDED